MKRKATTVLRAREQKKSAVDVARSAGPRSSGVRFCDCRVSPVIKELRWCDDDVATRFTQAAVILHGCVYLHRKDDPRHGVPATMEIALLALGLLEKAWPVVPVESRYETPVSVSPDASGRRNYWHAHVAAACCWIAHQFLCDIAGTYHLRFFVEAMTDVHDTKLTQSEMVRAQYWVLDRLGYNIETPCFLWMHADLPRRSTEELGVLIEQFLYPPNARCGILHDVRAVRAFFAEYPEYLILRRLLRTFCKYGAIKRAD